MEISQDVVSLSQAKKCSETELWNMCVGDYYSTMAAFSKYVEIENQRIKDKNG